jgi:hypothetical protein
MRIQSPLRTDSPLHKFPLFFLRSDTFTVAAFLSFRSIFG